MSTVPPAPIRGVIETCLYVDDLDAAAAFYRDVLQLPLASRVVGRHCFFRLPDGMLLLFDPQRSSEPGDVPPHGATGDGHVAFAIGREDFARWRDHLQQNGVAIEQEIQWGDQGGFSLYFRDPSGNSVELTCPETWGGTS